MGLNELTIAETREKIRNEEITTLDIVNDLKEAIEEDNSRKDSLNAYISFNMDEIKREIDLYSKINQKDTLLSGVPIAIKDIINVKGTKTTCASKILKDYEAPYDATAIEYLRKNGGVPSGKLNMDEFAMGSTNESSSFGVVRNPHNRDKIPGGSSGGAASAVAGNLAIAALGSDTGGSIRQPASMCGVFGIKPTYGRVSRYGLVAYASSFDQIGPITKTVMDGALLLEAISGHDEKDTTSANVKTEKYSQYVGQSIKGKRIGIPEEYFGDGLEEDVRLSVEKSIDVLKEAGAIIKKINLKYTKYAIATYYIIATAEASSNLARYDGIRYGTRFVKTDDLDTLYRKNRSIGFGDEVKRRILLGTFTLSSGYYDAYYLKAQKVRTLIREDFKTAFNGVDIIVTPVTPKAAWNIGQMVNDPLQMYLSDIYTVPINIAGLPAASVPCGKTSEGLPVGLQIIAYHFNEADIFRAARIVEEGV
ncbi:MAG: Asp-tRNA(Asn)/Glu-tRNA(Gln) amidotransferase GatCAB subunit A [Spirochaetes bacterium]|nr:MAG: Asp-tRNA(Asn)/Glu-tRNA(Gln) amidotransferase GatCAB subunit A [Spirochaetota bacterium]